MDRQTDRQTERQTERQTDTKKKTLEPEKADRHRQKDIETNK